jgi:UDPglucose--hexose-1-phosphate uridylyltransferase
MLDLSRDTHRRYNPLTGDWVLVSPFRTARPWQGQIEGGTSEILPAHDPNCYLCPGNARAGDASNPNYASTFVFDNDFPSMKTDSHTGCIDEQGLIVAFAEPGICRVVCFSPKHNLTLSNMQTADIRRIVDVWVDQYQELGKLPFVNSVQIFENRGAMMGASNPHPHGQIWANATVPNELASELSHCSEYTERTGECLLCAYLSLENSEAVRVVCENESFAAIVPFWAVWPFEMIVIARSHVTGIDRLNNDEQNGLADILRSVTSLYDKLFDTPFPYTMGFHQRPSDGAEHDEFHLHAHFYPPLLRSATVRKFMVGYEMLAMPQRDITPEEAAARLRVIVG